MQFAFPGREQRFLPWAAGMRTQARRRSASRPSWIQQEQRFFVVEPLALVLSFAHQILSDLDLKTDAPNPPDSGRALRKTWTSLHRQSKEGSYGRA